jgi:Zn-dependent alcohol dehydrogenase
MKSREYSMKAAVLHEVNKPLVIEDVSLPKPGPREVLIRTSVAGLCHYDLHFMEELYPHPLRRCSAMNPQASSSRSVPTSTT